MTPTKGSKKENIIEAIQNTLEKTNINTKTKAKFEVGDKVRISRTKGIFEKGYLPNWSEEVFMVDKVQETHPVSYIIKDALGEVIKGSFYNEELLKSSQELYRVERVIRKKKIDGVEYVLVKWSGYSDKFNQWIPMSDTEKLI